jgi:hypothetical protein
METGRDRVQIQLREIVNDINKNLSDANDICLTQLGSPSAVIVVAAHSRNRRELGKSLNDVRVTNVARVDDAVAAAKGVHRFRAEQAMRVGYQTNSESTAGHRRCRLTRRSSTFVVLRPSER